MLVKVFFFAVRKETDIHLKLNIDGKRQYKTKI